MTEPFEISHFLLICPDVRDAFTNKTIFHSGEIFPLIPYLISTNERLYSIKVKNFTYSSNNSNMMG